MNMRTRRRLDTQPQALRDDPTAARVYWDRLLRASVVVEAAGGLWIVPRTPGGWQRRQRLTMTPEARADRLKPARNIAADWLGIPEDGADKTECENRPRMNDRPSG
jgi:hypothetical protein